MLDTLVQWDRQLFQLINGARAPWLDTMLWYVSKEWTWIPLYVVILFYAWRTWKWGIWHILLLFALAVTLADQTASTLLKPLVQRLRPCNDPALLPDVYIVRGYCSSAWSFVSSHAANTAAVTLLAISRIRFPSTLMPAIMLTYWLLNCWSRVYLGVHFPGDVLVGSLIGAGWAYLLFLLHKRRFQLT